MNERIRFIVCRFSRTGWILLACLWASTGLYTPYPLYGSRDPGTGLLQSSEAVIYKKVNEERIKQGLPELAWASDVAEVARSHSEDMATNGFFAHVNPEGETLHARLQKAGIVFAVSAENLFTSNDFTEIADESVRSWINSPAHRDNLLNADIAETGIGIYKALQGNHYYITQVFIKRALKPNPSPTRLSQREIDTIFDIISAAIKKSKYDFKYSDVEKKILKDLKRAGIPVRKNVYVEGLMKNSPVLTLTTDIIAGDGFIVKFTDNDMDVELEKCRSLVHAQGYSAAVVINETDGKVRFPLIRMEPSEPE